MDYVFDLNPAGEEDINKRIEMQLAYIELRRPIIIASEERDKMNKILEYNGYKTRIVYSQKDNVYCGAIINIGDSVSFHSENISTIEDEFHKAVDDYIEMCKSIGKNPRLNGDRMVKFSILKTILDSEKIMTEIQLYENSQKRSPYIFVNGKMISSFSVVPLMNTIELDENGYLGEYKGYKVFRNDDLKYGEMELR
jgi:predicted HicB family RNase H-like nuclease